MATPSRFLTFRRMAVGFGVVAVLIALAGMGVRHVGSWLETGPSPAEIVTEKTQIVLDAVQQHPREDGPADLPFELQAGARSCWSFLQDAMSRSGNHYTLATNIFGDYGTPTGHGATEAVVMIRFEDGTRAELYYYQYRLEVCRDVTEVS